MKHARKDYQHIQDDTGRIPKDEPVFLLRGQDQCAADAVRFYAHLVEQRGGDPEVVRASRAQADAMAAWKTHKLPDVNDPPASQTAKPRSRSKSRKASTDEGG